MKVKDLIQRLEQLPPDMEVFLEQTNDEFWYSKIENVEVVNIRFIDPSDEKLEGFEECVVISDEI